MLPCPIYLAACTPRTDSQVLFLHFCAAKCQFVVAVFIIIITVVIDLARDVSGTRNLCGHEDLPGCIVITGFNALDADTCRHPFLDIVVDFCLLDCFEDGEVARIISENLDASCPDDIQHWRNCGLVGKGVPGKGEQIIVGVVFEDELPGSRDSDEKSLQVRKDLQKSLDAFVSDFPVQGLHPLQVRELDLMNGTECLLFECGKLGQ